MYPWLVNMMVDQQWSNFYRATKNRAPRDLFLESLKYIPSHLPRLAYDIGFGSGNEAIELINRGWQVIAIDQEEEAAGILNHRIGNHELLTILVEPYHQVKYQPVSLIHCGFSLPFCHPSDFDSVWSALSQSLLPEGIFCGQLFGPNDAWSDNQEMTFHSSDEVDQLLSQFRVIRKEETDEIMKTATGSTKHWHYFDIIAQKKSI